MTPTEIVSRFLDRWNVGIEEVCAAFRDTFNADTVYDNVGSIVTVGPEEASKMVRDGSQASGFVRMGYDMVNICEDGNHVYTERVDRFYAADGTEFHSLRVMGIFQIDEAGKIAAWRDYFDSRAMDDFQHVEHQSNSGLA